MPREFKDFDEFAAEEEPLRFRLAGKDYEIHADVPAATILKIRRMELDESNEDQQIDLGLGVVRDVLGAEEWQRILDSGIGQKKLTRFVTWLMGEIMGEVGEGNGDDEAPKAEEGAPPGEASPSSTSSSTGGPSSPTSNVFGLYEIQSSAG